MESKEMEIDKKIDTEVLGKPLRLRGVLGRRLWKRSWKVLGQGLWNKLWNRLGRALASKLGNGAQAIEAMPEGFELLRYSDKWRDV